MSSKRFQDLQVYQLAERLANEIWTIVNDWNGFTRDTVGKQIVRSADSIGANIAEGVGRGSFQDNRRFIRIARGSLNETQHWLRQAYIRHLLTDEQVDTLKSIIDELAPKLNAYLKSIGDHPSSNQQMTNDK
ncbi:MAG: four helix bundle protein [Coleofasciculus sp. B1-GNL1-01]|uniref:four helix bundle protein n=1 Tax=Coleofasciculus sp. B1-GNL1-01 TaxID=3068484 RepID=UPI0032FD7084